MFHHLLLGTLPPPLVLSVEICVKAFKVQTRKTFPGKVS